jgi:hypothetical protein
MTTKRPSARAHNRVRELAEDLRLTALATKEKPQPIVITKRDAVQEFENLAEKEQSRLRGLLEQHRRTTSLVIKQIDGAKGIDVQPEALTQSMRTIERAYATLNAFVYAKAIVERG